MGARSRRRIFVTLRVTCKFSNLSSKTAGLRRFLKKNFLIQDVGAGLIKMSYLGNSGCRSKRASTACIAALPSAMPFW
jgi:hypothetical protein